VLQLRIRPIAVLRLQIRLACAGSPPLAHLGRTD
jgi:hypothetical protein